MINQQKGIGYILKYDEQEGKGVLVYGNSASPQLFFKKDCLSPLKTGQLAYFSIDKDGRLSLNRASIDSIDIEAITNNKNRYIRFKLDSWLDDFYFDMSSDDNDSAKPWDSIINNSSVDELFEGIKTESGELGLYNSYTLDVFNIHFWIDLSTPIHISQEHLFLLFDLFALKRYTPMDIPNLEKRISFSWSFLLSSFTNEQLLSICQKQPLFQSVLPISFCEENLGILLLKYGFPNNEVCEHYLRFRIENISTTTEYYEIKSGIQEALLSNTFHRQNPLSQEHYENAWPTYLEKPKGRIEYLCIDTLNELKDSLNRCFWKILPPILNRQLQGLHLSAAHYDNLFLTSERIEKLIEDDRSHFIKTLGLFLDEYYCIADNIGKKSLDTYRFISSFEELFCNYPETANYLRPVVKTKANECIIITIRDCEKNNDIEVLGSFLLNLFPYLEEDAVNEAKKRINEALDKTENADDILWALCKDLVDEGHRSEMIEKYKTIVRDYSLDQFEMDLRHDNIPNELQVFIIQKIIDNSTLNSKVNWLKSWIDVYINKSAFLMAIEPYIISLCQEERDRLLDLTKPDYSKDYEDYLAHKEWENSIPEDNDTYSGTYAHDEAGYTDEEIDSIFGGDPSAYWNID